MTEIERKAKKAAYMRQYKATHPEYRARCKDLDRKRWHENHEENLKRQKERYLENRDRYRASDNSSRNANHGKAVKAYGGFCSICGTVENLDLHHTNDDGKRIGNHGHSMVNDLLRRNCPADEGIVVLCHSCHSRLHASMNARSEDVSKWAC